MIRFPSWSQCTPIHWTVSHSRNYTLFTRANGLFIYRTVWPFSAFFQRFVQPVDRWHDSKKLQKTWTSKNLNFKMWTCLQRKCTNHSVLAPYRGSMMTLKRRSWTKWDLPSTITFSIESSIRYWVVLQSWITRLLQLLTAWTIISNALWRKVERGTAQTPHIPSTTRQTIRDWETMNKWTQLAQSGVKDDVHPVFPRL